MKMFKAKSLVALLLAFVMLISLAACRKRGDKTTDPVDDTDEPTVIEPVVTEPPEETTPPETVPIETEPSETTLTSTQSPVTEPFETELVETEPVETAPLCEHKFYPNTKRVIPTCQAEGYTEYTCKICNEKVKKDFKPIVDHLYVKQIITYPSCSCEGEEATVCTYCGEVKEQTVLDAIGHSTEYVEVRMVSPVYHTARIARCMRCSEIFYVDEYLEEHEFESQKVVEDTPTIGDYTDYGYEIFKCKGEDCDYTFYVSSNASDGHYYTADEGSGKMVCRCGKQAPIDVKYNDNPNAGPKIFETN